MGVRGAESGVVTRVSGNKSTFSLVSIVTSCYAEVKLKVNDEKVIYWIDLNCFLSRDSD